MAIIGGYIGSFRGRAGFGCFLGLLIGPLGWVIVLLMPDARVKPSERNPFETVSDDEFKRRTPPDQVRMHQIISDLKKDKPDRRRKREGWY